MKNKAPSSFKGVNIAGKDLEQYLIQWRLSLWYSIRHKETIIWSFIAFYVAAIGVMLGFIKFGDSDIPLFIGAIITAILSAWGIAIVMDAAVWYARNIFTISRIERLFILDGTGQLIPDIYLNPRWRYQDIYVIQVFFYTIVTLFVYIKYILDIRHEALSEYNTIISFFGISFGIMVVFWFVRLWEKKLIIHNYFTNFRDYFTFDEKGQELKKASSEEKEDSWNRSPGWISSAWIIITVTGFILAFIGCKLGGMWFHIFVYLAGFLGSLALIAVLLWWGRYLCGWKKTAVYRLLFRCTSKLATISTILVPISILIFLIFD